VTSFNPRQPNPPSPHILSLGELLVYSVMTNRNRQCYDEVIERVKKSRHLIRDAIAKDLRTPKFKMQVIKDKRRKEILKQIEKLIKEYGDE
jgi:hypothetical protein